MVVTRHYPCDLPPSPIRISGNISNEIPSKRMILERARCVEFLHISSGWFKHIEPHRTPSKRMILQYINDFNGVQTRRLPYRHAGLLVSPTQTGQNTYVLCSLVKSSLLICPQVMHEQLLPAPGHEHILRKCSG